MNDGATQATQAMQIAVVSALILLMLIIVISTVFLAHRINSARVSNDAITQLLTRTLIVLEDVQTSLPIIKGYAELGRIGGSQSREVLKEVKSQTETIPKIAEKIDHLPEAVSERMEKTLKASTGSKDFHPDDLKKDKPKPSL